MATPTPTTVPTEPIGSIPRPIDLIEQVAKADSEDPDLAPLCEDAIRRARPLARTRQELALVRGGGQFLIEARCDCSA
jgi:hypothetical protein